jgi:hypothetical protein
LGHSAKAHADAGCRNTGAGQLNLLAADDLGGDGCWRHRGRIKDFEGVAIAGPEMLGLQTIGERRGQIHLLLDGHIEGAPVTRGFGEDAQHVAGGGSLGLKPKDPRAQVELKSVQRQVGMQVGPRAHAEILDNAHGVDPHGQFFFQVVTRGTGAQAPVRIADPALVLKDAHPGITLRGVRHSLIGQ